MTDYKHTPEDLKIMQAWPLERKVQVAQARIIEWHMRWGGRVYISFSGGKDSSVLLDLARRCFPDIEAVYVDTGLEFPEVRTFALSKENVTVLRPAMRFDEVVRAHGWCYPSKDVARTLRYAQKGSKWAHDRLAGVNPDGSPCGFRRDRYAKWAYLKDGPVRISDACCEIMKERPLDAYARQTGKHPITGIMATESRRREESWLQTGCNAFDGKRPVSKPLSFWTEQDVLRYLRDFKLPYASVYGDIAEDKNGKLYTTGEKRTGCIFCPVGCHLDKVNRFQRLAVTHPKLHDYVINQLG
ncbi:MAG: phosphoadenosine phosphosulfate reductase family protein, partial [Oscillospiraceae bacterium]|nr:phosphoadenosine phosphosulfate reductase family protein [Oscillospiraceae bacterium]